MNAATGKVDLSLIGASDRRRMQDRLPSVVARTHVCLRFALLFVLQIVFLDRFEYYGERIKLLR